MTWRKEALRIFSDAGARLLADNDEAVEMPKVKGLILQRRNNRGLHHVHGGQQPCKRSTMPCKTGA